MQRHFDRDIEEIKAMLSRCLDEPQQRIAREVGYLKMPSELAANLHSEVDKISG